jgi:hypothetical protein
MVGQKNDVRIKRLLQEDQIYYSMRVLIFRTWTVTPTPTKKRMILIYHLSAGMANNAEEVRVTHKIAKTVILILKGIPSLLRYLRRYSPKRGFV